MVAVPEEVRDAAANLDAGKAFVELRVVDDGSHTPPRGAHAVDIADGNNGTYFLTTFGRATRTTVCSCEVKIDPNLSQALHLLNGDTLQTKIEQGGVVKKLLQQGQTPSQIIENLYLRCLSRKPTEQEAAKLKAFFTPGAKPAQVLNDIFWSLLNAKEFVFNH